MNKKPYFSYFFRVTNCYSLNVNFLTENDFILLQFTSEIFDGVHLINVTESGIQTGRGVLRSLLQRVKRCSNII